MTSTSEKAPTPGRRAVSIEEAWGTARDSIMLHDPNDEHCRACPTCMVNLRQLALAVLDEALPFGEGGRECGCDDCDRRRAIAARINALP